MTKITHSTSNSGGKRLRSPMTEDEYLEDCEGEILMLRNTVAKCRSLMEQLIENGYVDSHSGHIESRIDTPILMGVIDALGLFVAVVSPCAATPQMQSSSRDGEASVGMGGK